MENHMIAKTYTQDLPLFKELGLWGFETATKEELYVGEYKLPNTRKAVVKIWVVCLPAQFWRFQIETDENERLEIETGSGPLSDFWPSIRLIAEGGMVLRSF